MKNIKQLQGLNPQKQLKHFFKTIHLGQVFYLASLITATFIIIIVSNFVYHQITNKTEQSILDLYGKVSFLTVLSFSDFILIFICTLSDYRTYQSKKGTLQLLISIIFRSHAILIVHYFIKTLLIQNYPIVFNYGSVTSIPLQVVIMIGVQSAVKYSKKMTYVFIKPFQIRSVFKPVLYFMIFQLISLRFDIIVVILVEFLLNILKIEQKIGCLCEKTQQKFTITKRMIAMRYMSIKNKQQQNDLNILKTNNSIIMQQK